MTATILINRAPVLTLWAAVVAQRLGIRCDESLSLGKPLAGLGYHRSVIAERVGPKLGVLGNELLGSLRKSRCDISTEATAKVAAEVGLRW